MAGQNFDKSSCAAAGFDAFNATTIANATTKMLWI
jgi:hypothetical protein